MIEGWQRYWKLHGRRERHIRSNVEYRCTSGTISRSYDFPPTTIRQHRGAAALKWQFVELVGEGRGW